MMSPQDTETVLKFLIDKLDPADKADLEAILGGEVESVAQDVMNGRLKLANFRKVSFCKIRIQR